MIKNDLLKNVLGKLNDVSDFDTKSTRNIDFLIPDLEKLSMAMDLANKILFPSYFIENSQNALNLSNYAAVYLYQFMKLMQEQVSRGLTFINRHFDDNSNIISAEEAIRVLLMQLPRLKEILQKDVLAIYHGDPAAKNIGEIVYCYPGIKAITHYRFAHLLNSLGIPLIPRMLTEMAHSKTSIDIHPGATIGESFAIDHGTGIVIGETCRIGNNVKIYQGVTLGAVSFPIDQSGQAIKGLERHPVIEDNVVIYSGATILGRIVVGKNSVIGGNVWLTHDVPPNSRVIQRKPRENLFIDGAGI